MRSLLILAMKHKAIAMVAVAALSVGSAAAFASQDGVFPGTDDGVSSQIVGQEEAPTPTPTEVDEPTPTPTATVEDGDDEDEGEGPRDVVGIPDDNPSKQPEDDDGVCEKGETVIKTTPSGKQVNVPCQAVKEHGPKANHGHDEDSQDSEDEEGTE
ncbi:MAG TPA: hypothetical protein VM013_04010 [Dehalococcoidia bacterium]|nr:hypothetical protein [Dehalococcoidia bacterium]